jgi:O-antigen/teichoic acid export membrane protein
MSIVPGGYVDSAGSLRFLIWAEVFIFLNMAFYNALNAMNREKWNFAVTLIMLAANVLMNLALIPRFSHRGASAATLVTEALGCLFITYLSLGCCRESMHFGRLLRTLATGIVLALVAGVLNGLYLFSTLSAFGLMFLLSLLYLLILHFTGAVPLREVLDLLRPPLPEAPAEK